MSANLFPELTIENVNANYTLRKLNQLNASVINTSMLETQSARYYGAGTGDATVDDTPLIRKCIDVNINQPYGGIVYLPDDAYYIKTPLVIPPCSNLKFYGNGATLLLSTNAYVEFNACSQIELSGIKVVPVDADVVVASALRIINCRNFNLHDVDVIGNNEASPNINKATQFANGILLLATLGSTQSNIISNCLILSCFNGIVCACEYVQIININVMHCSNGVVIPTGNSSVKSSTVTLCRNGIYVYGPNACYMVDGVSASYSNNPDHSMIIGCTINHCSCTGILFNSCTSGFIVSANIIIANGLGLTSVSNSANPMFTPFALDTYAYDPVGKLYGYGIYIQRSVQINIVSNHIQQNYINVGGSAYKNCSINSNVIHNTGTDGNLGVLTRGCIVDYNNDNIATSAPSIAFFSNQYNCIANNNLVGRPSSSIFGNSNPILFNGTLSGAGGYSFKGNMGSAYRQNLRLTTSDTATTGFTANPGVLAIDITATANYHLSGSFETYYIDFSCTSQLTFSRSLDNTSFNIVMIGTAGSKEIVANGLTNPDDNFISGTGLVVTETGTSPNITRTFTFSKAGLYQFINISADQSEWFIQCPP